MSWITAFPDDDLAEGEMKTFDGGPQPILICRVGGQVYAVQDTCTHDTWSLADGFLDGDVVECSLHFAKFCVKTGKVKALPACVALKTFPAKSDAGFILVDC
ncbi:non-heme iron oxygenase ferredoxin subunit [Sphingomonas sp. ZB1N12]|uniref:non-heme iron oxygenase ferredoxin subunit n=1 Tax=Sphingomonas arabinosi TaxID=3096160 RepID=UPI002FC6751C